MQKISGVQIASQIIENLKKQLKPNKILAAILVGDNQTSISFLKQKEKTAQELGVDFRIYKFPIDIKNDDLRQEIVHISGQKPIGGVIVQLPLPEHLNRHYALNAIPRGKDVDVLGERALGAFYTDRNPVLPPVVEVVKSILTTCNAQLVTLKVAIVGQGFLVGKPIFVWLKDKVKELYILGHESDLAIIKNCDLVITATGKANLIKPEMLKENASVIDFGYSFNENKIQGDFDASLIENCKLKIENSWYTPTPGGTGPILVAKIFENFYKLCQTQK